jgi:deoxyribonuclease-4
MSSIPIGFHVSIAGGLAKAIARALDRNSTALQIFAGNPRSWHLKQRSEDEILDFAKTRENAGIKIVAVHACYLINLCSPDEAVLQRSADRLANELRLAHDIGADYYVIHPGSQRSRSIERGIQKAAEMLTKSIKKAKHTPEILLENTASKHGPGAKIEYLAGIIQRVESHLPESSIGVAIDTCHAFAAGYDLRDKSEVKRLVSEITEAMGISRLRLIHANDSRDEAGSGRDRHWHIGEGMIGEAGLRQTLRHPALKGLPLILETPGNSIETDHRNLQKLLDIIAV